MTPVRAISMVVAVAVGSAVLLAIVSRAPARVRLAEAPREATDPSLRAHFSDRQIARHGRYQRANYLSIALATAVQVVFLFFLARSLFEPIVERVERVPGGFIVHAVVLGLVISLLMALVALPLSFVRGYAINRAWGLSTQDVGGWTSDQIRSLAVSSVTTAVMAVAFFGIVRWQPRVWWLWGWAVFTMLTAVMVFIWPVAVAPLFNKFTPLRDEALAREIKRLGAAAGVDIDQVLVADASRRTTAENAYVAGLGQTKRMVLYDTLLRAGDRNETLFVAAHELGHEVKSHIVKGLVVASVGLVLGFGLLKYLSGVASVWSWAGASGISDLRAIPVLLLFLTVLGVLVLPLQSAASRHFEREADDVAIRLTQDPDTAVAVFRRLAFANLADLRPPKPAVWLLYSHPPIPERIRAVLAERRQHIDFGSIHLLW